jgi:streptomycin 6-kinase
MAPGHDGVVTLVVPQNLAESTRTDGSPGRREWLARLPAVVAELAAQWSIQVGTPFQPGGTCAWVAPARDAAGQDLALKVAWPHPEAADEAAGLRCWAGHGTVLVHRSEVRAGSTVLLLERCHPGRSLGAVAPEPEQDEIVAGLLRELWRAEPGEHPFRSLPVMCDQWATDFERRWAAAPRRIDAGLARHGLDLLRGLPATAGDPVLLATDLHAANILSAERRPWLVIDPKPYLGDRAFDVVQHLLNCQERLAADPVALARRMADLAGLDSERVIQWLLARCVQESVDQPGLGPIARTLASR